LFLVLSNFHRQLPAEDYLFGRNIGKKPFVSLYQLTADEFFAKFHSRKGLQESDPKGFKF